MEELNQSDQPAYGRINSIHTEAEVCILFSIRYLPIHLWLPDTEVPSTCVYHFLSTLDSQISSKPPPSPALEHPSCLTLVLFFVAKAL
jgi:hypothetical protein